MVSTSGWLCSARLRICASRYTTLTSGRLGSGAHLSMEPHVANIPPASPYRPSPLLHRSFSESAGPRGARARLSSNTAAILATARGLRYASTNESDAFETLSQLADNHQVHPARRREYVSNGLDYFSAGAPLSAGVEQSATVPLASPNGILHSLLSPFASSFASQASPPPAGQQGLPGYTGARLTRASSVSSGQSIWSQEDTSGVQQSPFGPFPQVPVYESISASRPVSDGEHSALQCERCPLAFPDMPRYWGAVSIREDG